ncbi:MAG: trigger factor [Bacteroidales bacterium]|nr:trigger factor [Bacteroidales bacterium]
MNISKENIDDLNAILKVKIGESDYSDNVDSALKDYKKKIRLDGFRPGKVPFGLVKKMYYKQMLVEEVNKVLSESLSKYMFDEKLRILGEPMPSEEGNDPIDWDTQTEFDFSFDIGLAPEFEVNLTKKDKVPYYTIQIDKEISDSYMDNFTKRFGENLPGEKVESGKELLTGEIKQFKGEDKSEEIIYSDKSNFSLGVMKDESIKKKFIGAKIGDHVTFDLKKAFPNDTEIASILQIDKEKVGDLESDFDFRINEISSFVNAEVNQELYDKAYGKDKIKSEEEFKAEIGKDIRANLDKESEMRFVVDAKEALVKKMKLELPVEFLNKWLVKVNEGKFTKEEIEKDFENFRQDLEWQLIRDEIVQTQNLEVKEEDILKFAKEVTMMQFMQYGLANIPEDQLEHYAKELLRKEEERKKLTEKLYEDKVVEYVKELVKVADKEVTADEFNKLYVKK